MRTPRTQIFHNRLQILVLLAVMTAMPAVGGGWDDFSFDLPGGYFVLRANAVDIHLWRREMGIGLQEVNGQRELGPLYELAINDRFLFAKNHAYYKQGGMSEVTTCYTIIDYKQHIVYSPLQEPDYQTKLGELGISQPIQWVTLLEAFRDAVQSGRADTSEIDLQLAGQIVFLIFLWCFVAPVPIAIAFLAGTAVRRLKGWSILKSYGWPAILFVVIPFCYSLGRIIYRWLYLRFL